MKVEARTTALEYAVTLTPEERRKIVREMDDLLFDEDTGELLEEYGAYPSYHPLVDLYYQLEIKAEEAGDVEEGTDAV